MIRRGDDIVGLVICAGIVACLVAAVMVRPQPLPDAAREQWLGLARAQVDGVHVPGRTYAVDTVSVDGHARPFDGQPVTLPRGAAVTIQGWALDPTSLQTPGGFAYRLDAGPWRDARTHIARPDVANVFGLANVQDSGFAAEVATQALRAGRHDVDLATVAATGRHAPLPTRIQLDLSAH